MVLTHIYSKEKLECQKTNFSVIFLPNIGRWYQIVIWKFYIQGLKLFEFEV